MPVLTTKLFENEKVAVWERVIEPGDSTGTHTHLHDYVFHVVEGSTLEVPDSDGNTVRLEAETGLTMYVGLDGDEIVTEEMRGPATHDAKNIGDTRYREILVELK